ncbi:hypothetical protein FPCIR_4683 [Fusarium pseudocircinatum]|uniref:Uncharacterized protein n=1 Tax=Fusarium pseudocircinatum TaxID=56676 RepID=A0A8H5PEQ3_9HYPO|nr:hypothetical protein FPCIR_4683 [Fusarium pseudocircinatum]
MPLPPKLMPACTVTACVALAEDGFADKASVTAVALVSTMIASSLPWMVLPLTAKPPGAMAGLDFAEWTYATPYDTGNDASGLEGSFAPDTKLAIDRIILHTPTNATQTRSSPRPRQSRCPNTVAYIHESRFPITATNNFVATQTLSSDMTIAREGFRGLVMGNMILPSGPFEHYANDVVAAEP